MKYLIFLLISLPLWAHDFSYFVQNDTVYELKSVKEVKQTLPKSLFIASGIYSFEGQSYDMSKEGLYRIGDVGKSHIQRIVYVKNLNILMQSLSWIHCHGYVHDRRAFSDQLIVAETRKVQMVCGTASVFYKMILESLGIRTRLILFLTLNPWNSFSNGHTLIEIQDPITKTWDLWDVDLKRYFLNERFRLDARQFVEEQNNNYSIYRYSSALVFGDLTYNAYDYSFFTEGCLVEENTLRKFYKHCAQVLIIEDNGKWYFTCDAKDRARVESYPYSGPFTYMDKVQFKKTFYPVDKLNHDF